MIVLAGGVGGAKLAHGLARLLEPGALLVLTNVGDDFRHLGLYICPDLDTVSYTLAERENPATGWGLARESHQVMEALAALEGPAWFRLGDRDLATHLLRSHWLQQGIPLEEVALRLGRRLGLRQRVAPVSNDPVPTMVRTEEGELSFQEYFVRRRCAPRVSGFRFAGVEQARPVAVLGEWLGDPSLAAIFIAPSNPFLSIAPMLAVPGVRAALRAAPAPVVALSPIVGGKAIKGPAAKMLRELSLPCDAWTVAEYYGDLLDGYVLDAGDRVPPRKNSAAPAVYCTDALMPHPDARVSCARRMLEFAATLGRGGWV